MKTFLNLKQYLILFAAIFSLTSCLKSDDPDFQIYGGACVKQEVTKIPGVDGEETTYSSKFTPLIFVRGYNYEQITNCTVSGGTTMIMGKVDDYGYIWRTSIISSSTDFPTGTYVVTATSVEGEQAQTSASFSSSSQTMKNKLEGSINYSNNKLTFEFNKVENATAYLVVAKSSLDATFFEFATIQEYTEAQISTGALTLEKSSIDSKIAQAGNYYLITVAIISSNSGNLVYQEGDQFASYTRE